MSVPQMSGQTLVNMTNDLLAGYQNAVDSRAMLTYLNMAKDEIWSTIKELHEEYFQVFSQSTDSTADYYFPQLSTATRNYTLPDDLRSIEYIEVTTPSFEESDFVYAKLNSPEFKEERRASNAQNGPNATNNGSKFHYTIAGKNQFVLASYPPADLNRIRRLEVPDVFLFALAPRRLWNCVGVGTPIDDDRHAVAETAADFRQHRRSAAILNHVVQERSNR